MRLKSLATRSIDSEIADVQRIIDADEAILQRDQPSEEKRDQLVREIESAQKRMKRLKIKRALFRFSS